MLNPNRGWKTACRGWAVNKVMEKGDNGHVKSPVLDAVKSEAAF